MWRSCNELSQTEKDEYNKRVEETNKVWGESKEKERRERVAIALGFEKEKIKTEYKEILSKQVYEDSLKSTKDIPVDEINELDLQDKPSRSKTQSSSSKSQKM